MSWTRRKLLYLLGLGGATSVLARANVTRAAEPFLDLGRFVHSLGIRYCAEQDLLVIATIHASDGPDGGRIIVGVTEVGDNQPVVLEWLPPANRSVTSATRL